MGLFGQFIFGIVGGWVVGRAQAKLIPDYDKWFRLSASVSATAFVSFWGVFGTAGTAALNVFHQSPLTAIASALFAGAGAMATSVLILWKRSPLTRGLPITVPMAVEKSALESDTATTIPQDNKSVSP